MERKIGEIFEYNGEWYQCIEGTGCYQCAFNRDENTCIADNPHCTCRSDKKEVAFKKLEKVGEPYFDNEYNIWIQAYKPYITVTDIDILPTFISTKGDGLIHLEIKQNKKEMINKKTNFVEEIDALCKRYNMAEGVRADFMAEVKEIIKDENRECKLKPFNLEAAKLGKPVCTRDGRKARIICFDSKVIEDRPLLVLIDKGNGKEFCHYYTNNGIEPCNSDFYNLMMLPEKKEGWVNICRNLNTNKTELDTKDIYNTKEEALQNLSSMTCVTTVKICWEE